MKRTNGHVFGVISQCQLEDGFTEIMGIAKRSKFARTFFFTKIGSGGDVRRGWGMRGFSQRDHVSPGKGGLAEGPTFTIKILLKGQEDF